MRVLGVDLGRKRIGLAVGESAPGVASPRPVLAASGTLRQDADAIARRATAESADAIVLGLPLNHDGTPSRMSRVIDQLAELLRERGQTVHTVDEFMTSQEAEAVLAESGLRASQQKRALDSEAACRIIERFFRELPPA
ncbi:MAG: Holliday junction resolvase RuvX [Fimbriimonadaceae bacterium]|nr:Holliday junction resolvase RuvX [Fimbriimonadaceae bacterium]